MGMVQRREAHLVTGQPGKSGGARRGAGAPPAVRFKNRQIVRVAMGHLWQGWREARVDIVRALGEQITLTVEVDGEIHHIIVKHARKRKTE